MLWVFDIISKITTWDILYEAPLENSTIPWNSRYKGLIWAKIYPCEMLHSWHIKQNRSGRGDARSWLAEANDHFVGHVSELTYK